MLMNENNEQIQSGSVDIGEETPQPAVAQGVTPQNVPNQNVLATESSLNQPQPVANVPPPTPKKKFPKKIMLIVGVVVGIIVIVFVIKAIAGRFGGGGSSDITWWGVTFEEEAIKPLLEDFKNKNPNVSVTYVKQASNDYRSRLTDSINKGTGPDIFEIHNSWVPMLGVGLDTVPTTFMTEALYSTSYYPVVRKDMAIEGGFGGIPLFMDALTLYVNTEIFEREGRVFPTTWEDVDRIAKGLTKKDSQGVLAQSGVALGNSTNVDYWEEILALLFLQNEANLSALEGVLAEGAFDYFTSFSKSDGTWDETMAESTKAFAAGKLAMLFAPLSKASEISTINPSLKYKTIILPQIAKATPDQPSVSYANYWVESVNTNSTKKSESWELLKFVSEEENLKKLHSGQEKIIGVYPRTEMSDQQVSDPVLGSVVSLLPEADSWYLYSEVFDSESGLNSQVREPYAVAVELFKEKASSEKVLEELVLSLSLILSKFTF